MSVTDPMLSLAAQSAAPSAVSPAAPSAQPTQGSTLSVERPVSAQSASLSKEKKMTTLKTAEPHAILSLTASQAEDLRLSFAAMNPIEFARHLHALNLSIEIQRAWLRAKIDLKPRESEEALQNAVYRALESLWARLNERAVVL
jgi:hypothetical protein